MLGVDQRHGKGPESQARACCSGMKEWRQSERVTFAGEHISLRTKLAWRQEGDNWMTPSVESSYSWVNESVSHEGLD